MFYGWKRPISMTSGRKNHIDAKHAWCLGEMPFMTWLGRIAAALMLGVTLLPPAKAQELAENVRSTGNCGADKEITFRGGTIRIENDLFANTDHNYTSGVAIKAVSRDITGLLRADCLPFPVRMHAQLIKSMNPEFWSDAENPASSQNVVAKFGQSMYTPEDSSRTDLVSDDRPYAGLLYMGLSWNRRKHQPEADREMLDTREVTLGVIGPWSLAKQSQNVVHDAIGSPRFSGWQHQLKNEPAFQFALDRKFKGFRGSEAIVPGFSAETIPSLGVRLGNIETSATLGIEGRIGWNLPNDFGSYPIKPGAENRAPSAATIHGRPGAPIAATSKLRPGVHFFGILEAKLVAYDFSLDGNLFRSSHSVTRQPCVAQAGGGVSMHGIVGSHGFRMAAMRVTARLSSRNSGQATLSALLL